MARKNLKKPISPERGEHLCHLMQMQANTRFLNSMKALEEEGDVNIWQMRVRTQEDEVLVNTLGFLTRTAHGKLLEEVLAHWGSKPFLDLKENDNNLLVHFCSLPTLQNEKFAKHIDAKRASYIDTARVLLSAGFPIDQPDPYGRSALSHAASSHQSWLVKVLLGARANPSIPDDLGNTPAHWALQERQPCCGAVLAELLAAGARAGHTNKAGQSVKDMCKQAIADGVPGLEEAWKALSLQHEKTLADIASQNQANPRPRV